MTIDELAEIANAIDVGPKQLADLQKSLTEAERQFENEARQRMPTAEWLNRQYTI